MADPAARRILAVLSLIISVASVSPLPLAQSIPIPHPVSQSPVLSTSLPALQGHKGPVVHTLDISRLIAEPELTAAIEQYSSTAGQNYLRIVLERGAPYLPFIFSVTRELELPRELAFLPVIESAFVPSAVSRSGATGLWQFMLNSISPYGISVDQWVDERRDFWKSTYGALRKLKTNYRILGDWLLAVGAYNCGLGRMQRAVQAAGSHDFWVLAREGYLPAETVAYVPRFLAVSHFGSYPGRYGLPVNWEAIRWRRVIVNGPVHLNRLAEAADIPLRHLTTANAELNQPVTPPVASVYRLKVKAEYADSIEEALRRNNLTLVDIDSYTINRGDTLYALSTHYGISVDLILEFNPQLNPRLLQVGQKILIPLMQPMPPYKGPNSLTELKNYANSSEYTIQPGDTLIAIARRFQTTPEELAYNNNVSLESILIPGSLLTVPVPEIAREKAQPLGVVQ